MKRVYTYSLMGLSAIMLAGCSLSPVTRPDVGQVQMPLKIHCPVVAKQTSASLFILPARAVSPYDTTVMYYASTDGVVKPYGYHQWLVPPAESLRQAVANNVRTSGFYRGVWASAVTQVTGSEMLSLQLTQFQQNLITQQFHASAVLQLTDSKHQLMGAHQFSVTVPATPNYAGYVKGAQSAVAQLTCQITHWLVG